LIFTQVVASGVYLAFACFATIPSMSRSQITWDGACEAAEFAAREDVEALKASGAQLAGKYLREAAPKIQPLAVEVPVCGEIAGVRVRGIVDILDAEGRIIDIKTASRKPSKISGDHAFQLATYATLLADSVSGETRIDSLVSTKDPQLVQIEHTPGESGRRLVERMYPLVAEGIANGLFIPNRARTLCGYCGYARECEAEYGGAID
jgi:CRISPR/Cas system-associated exonuclease Cas4 (RecB family)